MFQNLRKLFIYLLLLPRTFTFPIIGNHSSEKTTPDVDEAVVEKELLRYDKYLSKIPNDVERAELKIELKALVRQAKKAEQLLINQGHLEQEKENLQDNALKLFVIPYFCQKFELYGEHWDPKGVNIENFNPDDVNGTSLMKRDLDEQTRASYRVQAKKWNRILCSSTHPLAIRFRTALEKKFPDISLSTLAKDLGLAIALLNNAKHGVIANDPKLQELLQVDSAISALSKWASLSDPVILNVIYEFENVTVNRKWKPQ